MTRQEGVLFLKDEGVLVQEIASVRVSQGLVLLLPLLLLCVRRCCVYRLGFSDNCCFDS